MMLTIAITHLDLTKVMANVFQLLTLNMSLSGFQDILTLNMSRWVFRRIMSKCVFRIFSQEAIIL